MKIVNDASKKKFDVAVFVTSFNNTNFIIEALDSILMQKFKGSFHIFVHDDASTDGTQNKLIKYAELHPEKITLILQSENQFQQGVPIGLDLYRYSNSDFIAFCEADDYWNSSLKLAKQFRFLRRNEGCSIVHSPVNILAVASKLDYEQHLRIHLEKYGQTRKIVSGKTLTENNFIMTCSALLRREAIPELILNDVGSLQPLDYILFALTTRFDSIGLINECLATYRLHEHNYWSTSANRVISANLTETREFINKFSPFEFK